MIVLNGQNIKISGRFLKIARLDAEKYLFLDDPEPIIEGLRKIKSRVDLFTFIQRVSETQPKYSYPMEWDNFAAVQLTTFDEWWLKQIGFKARNKAKQAAKKGVVVKEVPFDRVLVKGIWEIYNECPIRQGRPFSHYGKSFEQVYGDEATFLDSSVFVGAYFDRRLIGFVKLVFDTTLTQAGLMNIVAMIGHRDKAVTNALVAQAVRSCTERHIPYLVYSNFAYGKKERSSIADFKERNAFQRIDMPRYHVPLTALGRVAIRFGLHHKLVDHLPASVAKRLREFRSAWYNRKFHSGIEAS
jgi:hypothetical protein